jgi:hypothetical protein
MKKSIVIETLLLALGAILLGGTKLGLSQPVPDARSPLEERLGAVESRLAEVDSKYLTQQHLIVPRGGMIPYFGKVLPDGFVWADGQAVWPNEPWVDDALRGKPVPNMNGGRLAGGPLPGTALGTVWDKGTIPLPSFEIQGSSFKTPSLRNVFPLAPGWVFEGANLNNPAQGASYAHPDFRDGTFFLFVNRDGAAKPNIVKWVREPGLGPSLDSAYSFVRVQMNNIGRGEQALTGSQPVTLASVALSSADRNPPFVSSRWIIRVK